MGLVFDQGVSQSSQSVDWRTQLSDDSRERIINKIMETLKRHLPISGLEGLVELRKIAVRFEEKIYAAATSQTDYLRKISLKMLTMETKPQSNRGSNSLPSNAAGGNQNPPDLEQRKRARTLLEEELKAVKKQVVELEAKVVALEEKIQTLEDA
ncbi:mediator of RNA polymerase II transcription subunit 15a-like [Tasmannia lanceolata]|uniref:mediator of RNA polymerase II transcription subunit 15a-like n=1 Tax=Tasmannia lanceolata TaxID=3420 RepID=UPI0040636773